MSVRFSNRIRGDGFFLYLEKDLDKTLKPFLFCAQLFTMLLKNAGGRGFLLFTPDFKLGTDVIIDTPDTFLQEPPSLKKLPQTPPRSINTLPFMKSIINQVAKEFELKYFPRFYFFPGFYLMRLCYTLPTLKISSCRPSGRLLIRKIL